MKKPLLGIVLVSIAAFFAGCSSTEYGTKIDGNKLTQIKKGITTRAEVEALLGPPMSVTMMTDGKRMLVYQYSATSSNPTGGGIAAAALSVINPIGDLIGVGSKTQTRTQMLQIVVNSAGIVDDYEFNDGSSTTKAQTGGIVDSSSTTTKTSAPETQPEKK
ncbi:MAG: outer membrane protein assembly factor BamE [Opitutae bacterium]|nr:outer membrane protein assembly factor BamE [Opitutae bacterium]